MFKKILIVSVCAVLGACASHEDLVLNSGCPTGASMAEIKQGCNQPETPEQTQKRIETYYRYLAVLQEDANKNKSL
ncbi:hypothetical protein CKA27_25825 [Vibrio coralliilyticus]|uniref:hypothetical protein n=1 Tax=Vibrio TaxID=662 RepID=UPI0003A3DC03|nr:MULTISPECIES: hypothetical protein [Vibrio]MDF4345858.1 hypothetical protein [Vibrio parahaemolyticus]MDF4350571.1 hypothetical protein [Vibrio parahaemolyticus]MDF4372395.1 hypothetical protein [Vibrio parahaemolyticus]MDF4410500.1 hypothetical protein [Vibrio parahaemolyticus]MDF4419851.1 hypothetical protein [Vibrio parahaemolyticus]